MSVQPFLLSGPHEKRIFSVIQKSGPLSKNQLLERTGYKLTTLSRFLRPLEERGMVVSPQFGESSGGRRPVLFDVDTRCFFLLGVDISRIYTRVVLTDLKLNILASRHFGMDGKATPERTVRRIAALTAEMMEARAGRSSAGIVLAGVGSVGPMSRADGVLLSPAYFRAPGWKNVPLTGMLKDALHCPVTLDNGANTAVLAESLYGIGRGVPRVIYVNCGVGIRLGTFFDGTLIRTPLNEEDVFGHMVVNADGVRCTCGKRGCLDCYASARGVAAAFASRRKAGEASSLPADASWKAICQAAGKGDALAADAVKNAARYLGVGLANLIGLLAPGLIVLSGPLIRASALFYETASETTESELRHKQNEVRFHRGGHMGDDAIAVGAAALALEERIGAMPDAFSAVSVQK